MCARNLDKLTIPPNQAKFVSKVLNKYILGAFISTDGGNVLYSFQIDPNIREDMVSSFISALAIFGEENLGKIHRITIEGLNMEMAISYKHNLTLTFFFRPNMVKDFLDIEMEHGLDIFHKQFKSEIENGLLSKEIYAVFDTEMVKMVMNYLIRINVLKENHMFSHLFSFNKE